MGNILVTGGAGFIGSNFCHLWQKKYPKDRIIVVDALTYAGNPRNLDILPQHSYVLINTSVCNTLAMEHTLAYYECDKVVHFAAESHVDRSIAAPNQFIETNVQGTVSMLQAVQRVQQTRGVDIHFHHVSTDEVYGALGPNDPAFTEQTQFAPNSPYAASKAASDMMVRAWHRTYGIRVTTTNCSNNYGPYQMPEKLIPYVIYCFLHNMPVPIYGEGNQIRDWLYVTDHCEAIIECMSNGKVGETYNIGGNCELENRYVVNTIASKLTDILTTEPDLFRAKYPECPVFRRRALKSLVFKAIDRPGHDFRYAIDASKAQRDLGFTPSTSFENGIDQTIRWYLENDRWVDNCIARMGDR